MLLHAAPSQYRIQSVRDDKSGEWKIVAGLAITTTEGVLSFKLTPWMHSDISKVSIFYRRQDPVDNQKITRLTRLLTQIGCVFTIKDMGK